MTQQNKLSDILRTQSQMQQSTEYGLRIHAQLQNIDLQSDNELAARIKSEPELVRLFDALSQAEVPIAGYINNQFVSRRIDRLRIDSAAKTVDILDFKTDVNPELRRAHYEKQLTEYKVLIRDIYPDYQVNCYILWTHTWNLERIV